MPRRKRTPDGTDPNLIRTAEEAIAAANAPGLAEIAATVEHIATSIHSHLLPIMAHEMSESEAWDLIDAAVALAKTWPPGSGPT